MKKAKSREEDIVKKNHWATKANYRTMLTKCRLYQLKQCLTLYMTNSLIHLATPQPVICEQRNEASGLPMKAIVGHKAHANAQNSE